MQRVCTLQCLTCGSNGTGSSVLISVENRPDRGLAPCKVIARCLLNAGDSVQRFCSENKIKLDKISAIVLTSLAPHNVAGLAGIILSMSDLGIGTLTIVGPSGLEGLMHNMRSFVNRKLVYAQGTIYYFVYNYGLFCDRYPVISIFEIGMNEQLVKVQEFEISIVPIFSLTVIQQHQFQHLLILIYLPFLSE